MVSEDSNGGPVGPSPSCPDCQAALDATGRDAVSFLLVDSLTVPVIGCEVHLEQFRLLCGLTADETAKLLSHRPAGGIQCPGCRRADQTLEHPVVQIGHGVAAVLACETHESDVIERFQAGLQARGQLPDGRPL
jgi:hypothetical protein